MSNENPPVDGVQPEANDSVVNQDQVRNTDDKVAYESYKRVLDEKKRRDAELAEMKAEMEKINQAKMEAEGNKDELIKSLRNNLNEKEELLKEKERSYAWNVISSQIKEQAAKLGCSNPEKLLKLMDKSDFDAIEVDEGFRVNVDDAVRVLQKQKEVVPEFFKKNVNAPKDGVPGVPEIGDKPLSQKSNDELWAKIKSFD